MYERFIKIIILFITVIICIVLSQTNSYAISQIQSNNTYNGIDVSKWQRYIDYSQVKESDIEIVYIKASQGTTIKDAYLEINYENAKANGLKVGFYHYLTATTIRRSDRRS